MKKSLLLRLKLNKQANSFEDLFNFAQFVLLSSYVHATVICEASTASMLDFYICVLLCCIHECFQFKYFYAASHDGCDLWVRKWICMLPRGPQLFCIVGLSLSQLFMAADRAICTYHKQLERQTLTGLKVVFIIVLVRNTPGADAVITGMEKMPCVVA